MENVTYKIMSGNTHHNACIVLKKFYEILPAEYILKTQIRANSPRCHIKRVKIRKILDLQYPSYGGAYHLAKNSRIFVHFR